jgi:hypothetical protein
MFEINKILKRAWQILWDYKVLWALGFLLALTGSGGGGGGGNGTNFSSRFNRSHSYGAGSLTDMRLPAWMDTARTWLQQNLGPYFATKALALHTIIWVGAAFLMLIVVIGLLLSLIRYPAETAVIRAVDEHEKTGTKLGFKQAWQLGWNHRAFHIWVIDLILNLPIFLFVVLFVVLIGGVAYKFIQYGQAAVIGSGILGTLILAFVLLIPMIFLAIVIGLVRQYAVRFKALEDSGIGESIARGWNFFKHNLKNTLLIWLVMIGVSIVAGIAIMIAAIILIPTYVLMAIPGAIVAAIPGAIGFGITTLFTPAVLPWIVGALVALPFFFMIAFSPLSFLRGLVEVFSLNVWTLTFRQLKGMEMLPPPLTAAEGKQPEAI